MSYIYVHCFQSNYYVIGVQELITPVLERYTSFLEQPFDVLVLRLPIISDLIYVRFRQGQS